MTTPPIVPGQPQQPYPYQAQQPYYPVAPPQPPRRGIPAWAGIVLTLAGLMLFVGVFWMFSLVNSGRNTGNQTSTKPTTAQVTDCTSDGGFYKATVSVRNNSSRTDSFTVTVEWVTSSGTRLAEDTEYFNRLAPGQEAIQESIAMGAERSDLARCRGTIR